MHLIRTFACLLVIVTVCAPSYAITSFDQNVTPDLINGSGNANGSFTTDRASGVELGLRGKLRFDKNGDPQNVFNSNEDWQLYLHCHRGTRPCR